MHARSSNSAPACVCVYVCVCEHNDYILNITDKHLGNQARYENDT